MTYCSLLSSSLSVDELFRELEETGSSGVGGLVNEIIDFSRVLINWWFLCMSNRVSNGDRR